MRSCFANAAKLPCIKTVTALVKFQTAIGYAGHAKLSKTARKRNERTENETSEIYARSGDGVMYDPRVKCELCPVMRGAMRAIVPAKLSSPLSEMKKCMPCAPNSASPPGTTSTTPGNVEVKMENTDAKDVVMKDAEPEKGETTRHADEYSREKNGFALTQKPSQLKTMRKRW